MCLHPAGMWYWCTLRMCVTFSTQAAHPPSLHPQALGSGTWTCDEEMAWDPPPASCPPTPGAGQTPAEPPGPRAEREVWERQEDCGPVTLSKGSTSTHRERGATLGEGGGGRPGREAFLMLPWGPAVVCQNQLLLCLCQMLGAPQISGQHPRGCHPSSNGWVEERGGTWTQPAVPGGPPTWIHLARAPPPSPPFTTQKAPTMDR